jgi:hypothetical protein
MNLVNPASRKPDVNQENNLCCVGGIVGLFLDLASDFYLSPATGGYHRLDQDQVHLPCP